jgi:hypothetical protein
MSSRVIQPRNIRLALLIVAFAGIVFCSYRYAIHDKFWLENGFTLTLVLGGQLALAVLSGPPPSPGSFLRIITALRRGKKA